MYLWRGILCLKETLKSVVFFIPFASSFYIEVFFNNTDWDVVVKRLKFK